MKTEANNILYTILNHCTIIIQNNEKVNPAITISEKWKEKKQNSLKMAFKMKKAGFEERSKRMELCGDYLKYTICKDCGKAHVKKANLCRDRLCPMCSWRLSLQRFGAMKEILITLRNAHPEYTYSLVTLTVKNCSVEKLSETISLMSKSWNLCLQQRSIKNILAGSARSLEITYNKKTHEVHPHYHIIAAWATEEPKGDMLAAQWLKATNKNKLIATVQAQNAQTIMKEDDNNLTKSILEAFKYSVKGSQFLDMPMKEFKTVVSEISGKRLTSYTGIIKEYAKKLDVEMETIKDEEIEAKICRDCGSFALDEIILKWSFGDNDYIKI